MGPVPLRRLKIFLLQDMIRNLVKNGEIEMDLAKNIYGEKFVADIKPVAVGKEEL